MTSERKKMYLYAGLNFVVGITIGIVLFYGQMKYDPTVFETEYSYDRTVEVVDFLRAWWLNVMWLFSVYIAQGLLRAPLLHPVVVIRGCASSYGSMYIINYLGIKEVIASVLPQCISVLPLIIWFSVSVTQKREGNVQSKAEGVFMRKIDGIKIFLLSMFAAGAETLFFAFLCYCLF